MTILLTDRNTHYDRRIELDLPDVSKDPARTGCDHSPISFRYAPASRRDFAWVGSAASRTTIQPSP